MESVSAIFCLKISASVSVAKKWYRCITTFYAMFWSRLNISLSVVSWFPASGTSDLLYRSYSISLLRLLVNAIIHLQVNYPHTFCYYYVQPKTFSMDRKVYYVLESGKLRLNIQKYFDVMNTVNVRIVKLNHLVVHCNLRQFL